MQPSQVEKTVFYLITVHTYPPVFQISLAYYYADIHDLEKFHSVAEKMGYFKHVRNLESFIVGNIGT